MDSESALIQDLRLRIDAIEQDLSDALNDDRKKDAKIARLKETIADMEVGIREWKPSLLNRKRWRSQLLNKAMEAMR